MLPLPETLPKWYTVKEAEDKGWTPETKDIVEGGDNRDIINAWDGTFYPQADKTYTVCLDKLQIISPIQVGGGRFPEGGILPAQVGGVPYIPGSSIRGAFLKWIKKNWLNLPPEEQAFWSSLIARDFQGWLPRKIRFSSVRLKNLKPFPLHAQQRWQIFGEKSKHLGVQWQVSPKPPNPNPDKFCLQVLLKESPTSDQKNWLETRLKHMLEKQGIGRGKASGFGRLASSIPSGTWEIELRGMKPCVQSHKSNENQTGQYRWNPQVLRANLRGYFTRLALSLFPNQEDALKLTEKIFGGLGCPAQLTLTSYLRLIPRLTQNFPKDYSNYLAREAHSKWLINVDCNQDFEELIGGLLSLGSRLGGLGAGWRRPPHEMKRANNVRLFRGSEFIIVEAKNLENSLSGLINRLQTIIRGLATTYHLDSLEHPVAVSGSIISIWKGEREQWCHIVHQVCSTATKNPPEWCGRSQERPSGYSVRQYEDHCLITVFDEAVAATLEEKGFDKIWCLQTTQ